MAGADLSQPILVEPMDNSEFFLRHVRRGPGVLSVMGTSKNWVDHPFDDAADALVLMERFAQTHSIYATMGTLRAGSKQRRAQDIVSLSGFFLDIDCHGKKGQAADIGQASAALRQFCLGTKIPKPSYLVASGHGLHAHWALPDPIPIADWERVAKKFKSLTVAFGLPADPTVTADPARVMRVPNSLNFRDPAHPVEVELLPVPGDNNYSLADFEGAVDAALAKAAGVSLPTSRRGPSALGRQLSQGHVIADTPENVELVRQMLHYLNADCGYQEWREIVWAVAASELATARSLARTWSATGSQWNERNFDTLWNSFDKGRSSSIGFGTLIKKAREAGFKGRDSYAEAVSNRSSFELRPRFRLLDRTAIMTQPPLRWRVKRLFPETGIGAIYGPSGSGKSFLGLDLGVSIASGQDWFGHRTAICPVTYVVLEGEAGLRNRVQAWEAHNRATIPPGFKAIAQPLQLVELGQIEELGALVPQAGVIIIDTLNRAAPGIDENSSHDMGLILAGMKRLQEVTGGLVLVVHHTGKDASKGLRGHSSLYAALDGAIAVERTATSRSWSAAKVKDGEDGKAVAFQLHHIVLGTDSDGDEVSSCAVGLDAGAIFRKPEPSGKSQKAALSTLRHLLSASVNVGQAGCDPQASCLKVEDAIAGVAATLTTTASNKRTNEARRLVGDLTKGGHLQSAIDTSGEAWLWQ